MTKSELLAKIDLLRGQGNQTDIAGVLADVLQGAVEGSTLEIPFIQTIEGTDKEEALAILGITTEQFDALVRGGYDKIKVYPNITLNKVYEEFTTSNDYVALFGMMNDTVDYGRLVKFDYVLSDDLVFVKDAEV